LSQKRWDEHPFVVGFFPSYAEKPSNFSRYGELASGGNTGWNAWNFIQAYFMKGRHNVTGRHASGVFLERRFMAFVSSRLSLFHETASLILE
jgi:hypothetical protein